MKKAIVLLLALAVLGGAAFAQVNTGVYLHGKVTVVDQAGEGVFDTNNWFADTLTFKASNDTMGFAMTYYNVFEANLTQPRDWNAYYTISDMIKVSVGNLRNATYRMGGVYGAFSTSRITGYGLLSEVTPIDGLKIGINLPFGTTAAETVEVLQSTDIGISYAIADLGKVIFLANLDLVNESNQINFGFNFNSVENLTAIVNYVGTFAATAEHKFGAGVDYMLMDGALDVGVEFNGQYTDALAWQVYPYAAYTLNDNVSFGFDGYYDNDAVLDVSASAYYDFLNGLKPNLTVGYTDALYYNLGVTYEVSF